MSMTSQANRAYVMREVNKVFGNDVNTKINNDKVAESDRNEEYAKEEIESKLDVKIPRFYYLPEGMEYIDFIVDEKAHTAFMQYMYEDQLVYLMILANDESSTGGSQNDFGKKVEELQSKYATSLNIELWEIMDEKDEQPAYALHWEYLNVYYELFGKIPDDEMGRIGEMIMY